MEIGGEKSYAIFKNDVYLWMESGAIKGDISPYSIHGCRNVQHSTNESSRSDFRTANSGKSNCRFSILVLLACVMLASGHGEMSQGTIDKACHFTLSPPGLVNTHMPSYDSNIFSKGVRKELTHHTIENPVKEDTTLAGRKIATINVTSWSNKIQRMITHMHSEFDILLIQEHHKFRKKRHENRTTCTCCIRACPKNCSNARWERMAHFWWSSHTYQT